MREREPRQPARVPAAKAGDAARRILACGKARLAAPALAGGAHLRVLHGFEKHLARTLGIALGLLGLAVHLALRSRPGALPLRGAPARSRRDARPRRGRRPSRLRGRHGLDGDGLTLRAALLHDRVIRSGPRLETLEQRLLGVLGVGLTISEAAVVRVLQGGPSLG